MVWVVWVPADRVKDSSINFMVSLTITGNIIVARDNALIRCYKNSIGCDALS